MMKLMLGSYHSNPWSDERKGDWGGATHNSHCYGYWTSVSSLIPAVLAETQTEAPTIIQQSPGGWLIMGTNLDYGN